MYTIIGDVHQFILHCLIPDNLVDLCIYLGNKSDPEEGAIAEDIATNLFDSESYSLQVTTQFLL